MGKSDPKITFFLYFEKCCRWFLLETYFNKNWYCSEFNLTGRDLGFTTRFWISKTELFVTVNSFTITERIKNQWIYKWICDIQIRSLFLKSFNTENSVDCIPFSYIDFFIWLAIKPNNLTKFYSRILEEHDQSSIFAERVLFNQSCSSVSWSVMQFSQDLHSGFSWFFKEEYFAIYTKKWQNHILGNCICCLDNWISETNLDQKLLWMML